MDNDPLNALPSIGPNARALYPHIVRAEPRAMDQLIASYFTNANPQAEAIYNRDQRRCFHTYQNTVRGITRTEPDLRRAFIDWAVTAQPAWFPTEMDVQAMIGGYNNGSAPDRDNLPLFVSQFWTEDYASIERALGRPRNGAAVRNGAGGGAPAPNGPRNYARMVSNCLFGVAALSVIAGLSYAGYDTIANCGGTPGPAQAGEILAGAFPATILAAIANNLRR